PCWLLPRRVARPSRSPMRSRRSASPASSRPAYRRRAAPTSSRWRVTSIDLIQARCVVCSVRDKRCSMPAGKSRKKQGGDMSTAKPLALLASILVAVTINAAAAQTKRPHNVILFVPDGLRALSVTPENAPAMAGVRDSGVNFKNSHSIFPTFTTANASAMATGHYLGDTGDWSNTIYVGRPVASADNSVTPFLENDRVLGEVDQIFGGDYLNEETILKAARRAGLSTAAIGKLGPVLIFDHT